MTNQFEYTIYYRCSNETNLVCDVKSIVIGCQSHIGLLGSVRAADASGWRVTVKQGTRYVPNQCVDLGYLNIIQFLHRVLNLPLVRLEVGDENEGVVLLDLLHRGLSVQWPMRKIEQ